MTIANVFVDSQDDIRLILLLMYKTIIIIIIIVIIIRAAYYYWAIKLPRYFPSAPHFTHTRKWGLGFSSSLEMF